MDLYDVFEDKVLEIDVPFRAHGRAQGVVMGGVLNVTRRTLPLRTTPANIPVSIDVDVTPLQLRDTISVEQVELPEGVECTLAPKLTLVLVLEPRRAGASAADEEAEGGEAAPAAEGDAEKTDS